jgi:hypothetical protein
MPGIVEDKRFVHLGADGQPIMDDWFYGFLDGIGKDKVSHGNGGWKLISELPIEEQRALVLVGFSEWKLWHWQLDPEIGREEFNRVNTFEEFLLVLEQRRRI